MKCLTTFLFIATLASGELTPTGRLTVAPPPHPTAANANERSAKQSAVSVAVLLVNLMKKKQSFASRKLTP